MRVSLIPGQLRGLGCGWSYGHQALPRIFDAVWLGANRACDEPRGIAGQVFGGRAAEWLHEAFEAFVQTVDGLDMECLVDDERALLRVDAVVWHAMLSGKEVVGRVTFTRHS